MPHVWVNEVSSTAHNITNTGLLEILKHRNKVLGYLYYSYLQSELDLINLQYQKEQCHLKSLP